MPPKARGLDLASGIPVGTCWALGADNLGEAPASGGPQTIYTCIIRVRLKR